MNLRTHLSRSNGYRLLGMYDESILILEDIPLGKDRWHSSVVEARYNTYRDAKEWGLAYDYGRHADHKHFPHQVEWLINKSDVRREMGDPPVSLEASLFNYDLRYIRS